MAKFHKRALPHRKLRVKRSMLRGRDVRGLQAGANARLRARGDHRFCCAVDGEYGPATARAVARALYRLGAPMSVVRAAKAGGVVTQHWQMFVRDPKRNDKQIKRATKRNATVKRKQAERAKAARGRKAAVEYAQRYAGKVTENPPGSNRGGIITEWQQALGAWLVGTAWCGTFCAACLRAAGVKGVNWRLASVAYIEDDARSGRLPFRGWTRDLSRVRPGDLVVLFGRGVHVELVVKVTSGGVHTVGGNTSSSNAGSQSNGGGVFARYRPMASIHGFALVDYDD